MSSDKDATTTNRYYLPNPQTVVVEKPTIEYMGEDGRVPPRRTTSGHGVGQRLRAGSVQDVEDLPPGDPMVRIRSWFMEYAAEFFGTCVFVMFGCGANCQANLGYSPAVKPGLPGGTWGSYSLGWGAGLAFGVWISGGHVNPAVTLSLAIWRGFPWRKVPGYWFSQLLGGVCGAGIVYGNYIRAIDIVEGGRHIRTLSTAGFFGTVPLDYLSNFQCFWDEFIGTALLVGGIFALLDKGKNGLTAGQVPIGIFILLTGITATFGMQTGFALNPARDLGPRMMSAMVGYGRQVFTFRNEYWLWSPILAAFSGGVIGSGFYDVFLYRGDDGIVNKLLAQRGQRSNDNAA